MDNPLVQVNPGLFFWTILTFLALLALLTRYAWKPLLKALEERRATIEKSVEDAKRATAELQQVQVESARLLALARSEASGIVTRSRADADRFGEEMRAKARDEAAAIVKTPRRKSISRRRAPWRRFAPRPSSSRCRLPRNSCDATSLPATTKR